MKRQRCSWVTDDPLLIAYHDEEWGVPTHDDQVLLEQLVLAGAQAGLSWMTILRKRENYRRVFDQFDPRKVAGYGERKVKALLADPGIVRNRLKIASSVDNARALLRVQEELGSFDRLVWTVVGGQPRRNRPASVRDIPPRTAESDALSEMLRQRGFRFVGSTICYAFMQACGLVNDHTRDCFVVRRTQMQGDDQGKARR